MRKNRRSPTSRRTTRGGTTIEHGLKVGSIFPACPMVAACFCFVFLVWAYGHNAGMTASLRRCGGLFDAVRALVHLLCQLSRTIAPTVTDYCANCHRSSGRIGHRFNLRFGSRWLAEPFDKPNEQSQACLDAAMARKGGRKPNTPRPNLGFQSVLVCERPWQMITATDKHTLAGTTNQSVLVCERPWQKILGLSV